MLLRTARILHHGHFDAAETTVSLHMLQVSAVLLLAGHIAWLDVLNYAEPPHRGDDPADPT